MPKFFAAAGIVCSILFLAFAALVKAEREPGEAPEPMGSWIGPTGRRVTLEQVGDSPWVCRIHAPEYPEYHGEKADLAHTVHRLRKAGFRRCP